MPAQVAAEMERLVVYADAQERNVSRDRHPGGAVHPAVCGGLRSDPRGSA